MTRKDYILAARIVRDMLDGRRPLLARMTAQDVADVLVVVFERDNPRFDEARFREACGL